MIIKQFNKPIIWQKNHLNISFNKFKLILANFFTIFSLNKVQKKFIPLGWISIRVFKVNGSGFSSIKMKQYSKWLAVFKILFILILFNNIKKIKICQKNKK